MKIILVIIITVLLYSEILESSELKIATTTSIENSGLLDYILPVFKKKFNVVVKAIPVGSGKALALGKNGDVDMIFVHSKEDELEFVKNGYGVDRQEVMYNYFVLIGPSEYVKPFEKFKNIVEAFKYVSERKLLFISRGDDSGTNKKEAAVWKKAGLKKAALYIETGQGMGNTLMIAGEKRGITLSDMATYLFFKDKINLSVLFNKGEELYNLYSVIAINPQKFPSVNYRDSKRFIEWITKDGQSLIKGYKIKAGVCFYPIK